MDEQAKFPPYRPLKFKVTDACCGEDSCSRHPDLAAIQFEVKELWGTSGKVGVGERYVVRATYSLAGADPYAISLSSFGKWFGATAYLSPGAGQFETSTEGLELPEKYPNGLGIVVGNEKTGKAEIVAWVMLQE